MKSQITPEMVNAVQKILKECAQFDGEKLECNIFDGNSISPCSMTQALFPEIIDLALEHFKRKCSISLTEWIDQEPKTCNTEYVNHEIKLKNKPLPLFDWSLTKHMTKEVESK